MQHRPWPHAVATRLFALTLAALHHDRGAADWLVPAQPPSWVKALRPFPGNVWQVPSGHVMHTTRCLHTMFTHDVCTRCWHTMSKHDHYTIVTHEVAQHGGHGVQDAHDVHEAHNVHEHTMRMVCTNP
jgi:hypothetical protein